MKCIVPIAGPEYFKEENCKGLIQFKDDFLLRSILYKRPWINKVDELIFIMQDLDIARDFEKSYLKKWFGNSKSIYIPSFTCGAAFSSLIGVSLAYTKSDMPIMIDLADIYFESNFIPYQKKEKDGFAFYFESNDPIYSYLKVDDYENIIETKEKKVISNKASAGVYCFPSSSSFIKSISYSILNSKKLTFNNLHYVCPLLNSLIASNIKVIPIKVKNVVDIKTFNL